MHTLDIITGLIAATPAATPAAPLSSSMNWLLPAIGVITGILTGVIANLATHFFTSVCLPAYRDYVYRGTRLDGDWTITHIEQPDDGEGLAMKWALSASLKQKAYNISGTAVARFSDSSGKGDIINYSVQGTICDGLMSLRFLNEDQTRVAHSTFLVRIVGDASTLKGYRVFYGLRMDTIRSMPCQWKRGIHGLGECSSQTNDAAQAFKVPR